MPFDCRDGFFCAYWRRPHAYLDPDVRASISALALLDDAVLEPGLARLEADLHSGAWHERNRALLERDAYDFGYRLVVTCRSRSRARRELLRQGGGFDVEAAHETGHDPLLGGATDERNANVEVAGDPAPCTWRRRRR